MPAILTAPRARRTVAAPVQPAPAALLTGEAPRQAQSAPSHQSPVTSHRFLPGGAFALHRKTPLTFTKGPEEASRDMALCAIDAGLITGFRKGEDIPKALARSLAERLGPLAKKSEHFIHPLYFILHDCTDDDHGSTHGRYLSSDRNNREPVAEAVLEVHRSMDHYRTRIIGPRLMSYEKRRKGMGLAVWRLLDKLWNDHGPGAWTTRQAMYTAQHFYWLGEENEKFAIENARDENGENYTAKGADGTFTMTDDQVCEQCGIIRRREFGHPHEWGAGTPPEDPTAYPRELRAEVKAALAVLSRIPALLRQDPEPQMERSSAGLLNIVRSMEQVSEAARPPLALQWNDGDPAYRVLDDEVNNDFESGESAVGYCAAFPFTVSNPATLAHALDRAALFCEVMAVATPLTLKATTTNGKLTEVLTEPQDVPIQIPITV